MKVNKEDQLDNIFKALSDRRRRKMLEMLMNLPLTTGNLCAMFDDLDRCTVMQHLGVLEKAGLITVKREGRLRWNHINTSPVTQVQMQYLRKFEQYDRVRKKT